MNTNSKHLCFLNHRCAGTSGRLLASILFLAVAASAVSSAQAVQFGLQVIDNRGLPVEGASVCVGLPGNYKQFGSSFTDKEGLAVLDVPNVPLVVTVSKTRFRGTRLSEPAREFNLIRQVTLSEGQPGPRCRAGSTMAEAESSLRVEQVDVIHSADTLRLQLSVSGKPSHYRLSTADDFKDARWLTFDQDIELPSSLSQNDHVYLQARRLEGTNNAWLEARSSVVQIFLP